MPPSADVPIGSDLRKRTCFELGFGLAAEAILKFAGDHGVGLIVMGVRRLDPVIGAHIPKPDTTYEVVRNAPCPVLTARRTRRRRTTFGGGQSGLGGRLQILRTCW
jgi:hypothetical protein